MFVERKFIRVVPFVVLLRGICESLFNSGCGGSLTVFHSVLASPISYTTGAAFIYGILQKYWLVSGAVQVFL